MPIPVEAIQRRFSAKKVRVPQVVGEPASTLVTDPSVASNPSSGDSRFRDTLGPRTRLVGAIGTGITAALVSLAACTAVDTGNSSSSSAKPDTSTSASAFSSPDQSPTQQPTGGICSTSETPHVLQVETGVAVDDSPKSGVVVSFRVDNQYNDRSFPGSSLEMLVDFLKQPPWPVYTRVASIEERGNGGPGGLIDVTHPTPYLNASHPVVGIDKGDVYTVEVGAGNSATGEMNARKYTVDVGPKNGLGVKFDGCAPLGPSIPYRNGTPQH